MEMGLWTRGRGDRVPRGHFAVLLLDSRAGPRSGIEGATQDFWSVSGGAPLRVLVVVQARTGSTRLPGRGMVPLAHKPVLGRIRERLQAARTPSQIVVATTTAS